jgi:hypothetical protein
VCRAAADPDAFTAMCEDAERDGATIAAKGTMPGGMQFAYVAAPNAGVPYLEIAYIPPDIQTFFDYVKQEQQ